MFVCDITTFSLLGTRCMQSTNIYKVKPNLCFWSKNVRTGCKRQGQKMREGWVGNIRVQCKRTWSPSTFCCIVAPMGLGLDLASGLLVVRLHTYLYYCSLLLSHCRQRWVDTRQTTGVPINSQFQPSALETVVVVDAGILLQRWRHV